MPMNKRINELAEQCHHLYSEHNIDLEKFTELIVQECAKVCLDPNHWHEDAAGEIYSKAIKEHFGVEL
jgi:hypothetical protein